MMAALALALALGALTIAALVSQGRKLSLAFALFVLAWVVGHFNALIEAVVFNVLPLSQALAVAAGMAVVSAVLALLAVTIGSKWRSGPVVSVRPRFTPLRLLGVIVGYELLYFVAGMIIFPFVRDFYVAKTLPPFGLVAGLQVARALIFAAATWPWLRTGPRHAPLVLGIVFSVIGGIAPLLPDNPYMPANIRLVHGFETGISNFLFGMLLGWLLLAKPAA